METFLQRRHKITTFSADRSSGNLLSPTTPASLRGKRQVQINRNFSNLAYDSSSCSSDTAEEDSFTFELGWTSSKQSIGIPMKKLLAQEMSKENESRRRSPSVIARLMGLDGPPPHQPGHKQQKRSTENGHDKAQKNCTVYGRRSSRKSSKEEQEFKDVFEVLDTSKMESTSHSQEAANLNITEAEMAFIRQKFMDAKRLSTDERLQGSKEFDDVLEVLDSNKDLLLKFLQQPDPLFTKHLHDLQTSPQQSHCGRISAMKSSRPQNYVTCSLDQKAERETPQKNYSKSTQKHQKDLSSHSYERCAVQIPDRSSKLRLEEKTEPAILPTRIVVLKPNLGKSQNATRTASSPCSSHHLPSECVKNAEVLGIKNREPETWGKKKVHENLGFSRHNSRESREIAKEVTKQMRNSISSVSVNFSTSRFRGYAGDESSCDLSGSESANDSDVMTGTSRDTFDWNKRHRRSLSRSSETSVSREAKKRLSERWKMTHRSQKVPGVGRGSTLGEMLAIPDREVLPENFSGVIGEEGCSGKFGSNDGLSTWDEPLGISSRDGWKDGCLSNLSRSRSLPASADFGSPNIRYLRSDKHMIPKEGMKRERHKAVKGYFNQREGSLSRNSKASGKKSQCLTSNSSDMEISDTSPEVCFPPCHQEKRKFEEDGLSEKNNMVLDASTCAVTISSSVPEIAVIVDDQNETVLFEPSRSEAAGPASENGDFLTGDLDNLSSEEPSDGLYKEASLHHPEAELESHASSKEADQPSPVSVLEPSFTEDLSSGSECFESLSADLHGLRMQLQLLKLESEAYEEGPMLISSDDDANTGSFGLSERKAVLRPEENWESAYIVDVLIGSEINGTDPDTFMATWHSPECPINPSVFEELEKKYCNLMSSWSRAERNLLFDRINTKLLEIHQQFSDQHPWVKRVGRVVPMWNKQGLEDSLRKLLASQDKKGNRNAATAEKVLTRESQWLDLRDGIDVIGREIEKLLIDELVAEVAAEW